jgi:3-oxoacyl-[acyl-carrier-protein] synthase I
MPSQPIAIKSVGLVTSVGLSAPASCAAFRAKISNPTETRFMGADGEWIMAHQVALEQPWRGRAKLARMAAMAIAETLQDFPQSDWPMLPLLLCVAEQERPGRLDGLDDHLFDEIQAELGVTFAKESAVIPHGRVSVALALQHARQLLFESRLPRVVIAATDSLLSWPTLSHYDQEGRLLNEQNSNGFVPGEGAGAILVGPVKGEADEMVCTGVGLGVEPAPIGSGEPLRAEGLTQAVKACLADAGCQMHDMDFRIADVSGEQYYFKEAALALSRTLRQRKEEFDIWHPAECTGEAGAVSGIAVLANAVDANLKGYTKGPNVLAHFTTDGRQRAAVTLQGRVAQ